MDCHRISTRALGSLFLFWTLLGLVGGRTTRPTNPANCRSKPFARNRPTKPISASITASSRSKSSSSSRGSSNLLAGDFNNDGLGDLALFDNGHARIDLLLQRRRPAEASADTTPLDVNEVASDGRFEHKKIPLDKQLASMAMGDFNGDGRTDLACFGLPDHLLILYQPAKGEWHEHASMRVPDVAPVQWNMAAGDVNGDGKDDLVVLGRHQTYIFLQEAKGGLAPPIVLMNTSEKLSLAQVADLNGDGRKDLVYVAGEGQERTLCARLQDESGRLGPELQFEVDPPRSVSYADLDGHKGREILTIDNQTGRLQDSANGAVQER